MTDVALKLEPRFAGYSIDTRTIQPGDLYFAIRGERFDGHDFVRQAFEKGAAAAVVDHDMGLERTFIVPDTVAALQDLASVWRSELKTPLVAVTGSAGKTTTKDVIASLLRSKLEVQKTEGNLNNHIGLPLSLLRMKPAGAAVIEIGMNHAGEIRALAALARPDIAVVTNVGHAHIENFDSIEGIALAKRELVESLTPQGTAVLNGDDARVLDFAKIHTGKTVTFGVSDRADVRAADLELHEGGSRFRVAGVQFETSLFGLHGVRNILAGIAVAQLFGIRPPDLVEAVRQLVPGKMRGERTTVEGITIFNDCYNSNPDAAKSMLEVLRDTPAVRRIAVLGEMLELGRWAEPLHRDVGNYAVACGISVLVGIRGAARSMVDAAIEAGLAENAAYFFSDPSEAGRKVREIARPGDAILFKGSRGTRVEKALEAFLN